MTQGPAENPLLVRARACHTGQDCIALYEEWAATYNDDLAHPSQDYVAPFLVAQTALQFPAHASGTILDAGCGTGLVGQALARGGATNICGLDLSPTMLNVARSTGIYRNLELGDLNLPIDQPDESYDLVTCSGPFTHGHVGPDPALRTLIRLTKTYGILVVTVLEDIWLSAGFKAEVEKLEAENLVRVVSIELRDYRKGQGDRANIVVLEKSGTS